MVEPRTLHPIRTLLFFYSAEVKRFLPRRQPERDDPSTFQRRASYSTADTSSGVLSIAYGVILAPVVSNNPIDGSKPGPADGRHPVMSNNLVDSAEPRCSQTARVPRLEMLDGEPCRALAEDSSRPRL
jgi:hypothetical protein